MSSNRNNFRDEDRKRLCSGDTDNQVSKNSDKTVDTAKRAKSDFKNSQRVEDPKTIRKGSRLIESGKKIISKKKHRLKSPKKSKIKLNFPKEKTKSNVMMIKESLNCSIINDTIMSEKLIPPFMKPRKDSRLNMSEQKNHGESFQVDNLFFNQDKSNRNKFLSDPTVKHAINFSETKAERESKGKSRKSKL